MSFNLEEFLLYFLIGAAVLFLLKKFLYQAKKLFSVINSSNESCGCGENSCLTTQKD